MVEMALVENGNRAVLGGGGGQEQEGNQTMAG
jgi:hypothetical protein